MSEKIECLQKLILLVIFIVEQHTHEKIIFFMSESYVLSYLIC